MDCRYSLLAFSAFSAFSAFAFLGFGCSSSDATAPADAGIDTAVQPNTPAEDAAPTRTSQLLFSFNGTTESELAVYNLEKGDIAGRLRYPGFIGKAAVAGENAFVFEQANDIVDLLDPSTPWIVKSSWNVAMNDRPEGGDAYSDPTAVVIAAKSKAYVLRFTRNQIAVLDTSEVVKGGQPKNSIDLSSLVQDADSDKIVEMVDGFYSESDSRVYVLLANIDRKKVSTDGYTLLCPETKAMLVAIDAANDKVVDSIPLKGANPIFDSLKYDASNDRLLILHAGCNKEDNGGTGALVGRVIEAVSLKSKETSLVLDANSQGFPTAFALKDSSTGIVQFDFSSETTFQWSVASGTLTKIANAPDYFTFEPASGSLVGLKATPVDGGDPILEIVRVSLDGTTTKLGPSPFTLTQGFVSNVSIWTH